MITTEKEKLIEFLEYVGRNVGEKSDDAVYDEVSDFVDDFEFNFLDGFFWDWALLRNIKIDDFRTPEEENHLWDSEKKERLLSIYISYVDACNAHYGIFTDNYLMLIFGTKGQCERYISHFGEAEQKIYEIKHLFNREIKNENN